MIQQYLEEIHSLYEIYENEAYIDVHKTVRIAMKYVAQHIIDELNAEEEYEDRKDL